jgi:hypothetical protein
MSKPVVAPIAPQSRCSHRFPASGHQCRLLAADPQSGLCAHHLAKKKALQKDADFFYPLMQRENRFQTAESINSSLNHLYDLLARDRISVRRASALAYISSLLLRTLPAIDRDQSLGVTDECPNPCTKPLPTSVHTVPAPANSAPTISAPADSNVIDLAPADSKPADSKAENSTPEDSKPEDSKPEDSAPPPDLVN